MSWWKYVCRNMREDTRENRKFKDWGMILKFIKDRNRYISLYSRKRLSGVEKQIVMVGVIILNCTSVLIQRRRRRRKKN